MQDIIKLIKHQLARHLAIVFFGNIFAAGLGFLTILIISRSISVADFGLFNMAISVILALAPLVGFGIDTSMVKFASSFLGRNLHREARQILSIVLYIRLAVATLLAISIFSAANFLANKVYNYPHLAYLLRLSALGILSVSTFNYIKSTFYIYKMFRQCVSLQILVDMTKLLLTITLIFLLRLKVFYAVLAFVIAPTLGAWLGFWQLRHSLFPKKRLLKNIYNQLFSYSKWVFLSDTARKTLPYIGVFMIAKMLSAEAVGIYGLAVNLTYIFPIITTSLFSVLLPEVARFKEIEQFERYIKLSLKISLFIGIIAIPFLFLTPKLIPLFFGSSYRKSVTVFNWFALSYVFQAAAATGRSALYSMDRPHIIAFVDLFNLTLMSLGCYFLLPVFGIALPAILALTLNCSALIIFITDVFRHINRQKLILKPVAYYSPE